MKTYMEWTGNGGGDPDLNNEADEDEWEDEDGNIFHVDTEGKVVAKLAKMRTKGTVVDLSVETIRLWQRQGWYTLFDNK